MAKLIEPNKNIVAKKICRYPRTEFVPFPYQSKVEFNNSNPNLEKNQIFYTKRSSNGNNCWDEIIIFIHTTYWFFVFFALENLRCQLWENFQFSVLFFFLFFFFIHGSATLTSFLSAPNDCKMTKHSSK